jgi:hypothetical protein
VVEVAALAGIRSAALVAMTSFEVVDGNKVKVWIEDMEQALRITGAIISRDFGSITAAIDEVCSLSRAFSEDIGYEIAREQL